MRSGRGGKKSQRAQNGERSRESENSLSYRHGIGTSGSGRSENSGSETAYSGRNCRVDSSAYAEDMEDTSSSLQVRSQRLQKWVYSNRSNFSEDSKKTNTIDFSAQFDRERVTREAICQQKSKSRFCRIRESQVLYTDQFV